MKNLSDSSRVRPDYRVASRARVGSAPDSWGVWFPDDPQQTTWTRFLDEIRAAGYGWLELGPYGFLPTDPAQLRDELLSRDLQMSAGTVGGALHDASSWDDIVDETRRVAALTSAVGAQFIVFLPAMYRDLMSGAPLEAPTLAKSDWDRLIHRSNDIGRLVREEFGMNLVFHPHADSHVETQSQTEAYLDDTDNRWVNLCLDTGHIAYRRGDNVAIINRFRERVTYVHFKQVDPTVLDVVEDDDLPFAEAVRRGVTVEPPLGIPSAESIADALGQSGEDDPSMFVIVEQDMYPCTPGRPLPIARRTADHLRGGGWGF